MTTKIMSRGAKLVVERKYRATLEDVWSLWTTKEGFESWWGPEGFRAQVHELDAREGGQLRYAMIADTPQTIAAMEAMGQPRAHKVVSHFVEVSPHRRLVLRNVIDFLDGVPTYESDILVELAAAGDDVHMVVTLEAMHDDEHSKMQGDGFTSQLTKLDKRFA